MSTDQSAVVEPETHPHLPSEREIDAMEILYEEGWSSRELAMVFEITHKTVLNYMADRGVER